MKKRRRREVTISSLILIYRIFLNIYYVFKQYNVPGGFKCRNWSILISWFSVYRCTGKSSPDNTYIGYVLNWKILSRNTIIPGLIIDLEGMMRISSRPIEPELTQSVLCASLHCIMLWSHSILIDTYAAHYVHFTLRTVYAILPKARRYKSTNILTRFIILTD